MKNTFSRTLGAITMSALVGVASAQTVTKELQPGVTATTSNGQTVIGGDAVFDADAQGGSWVFGSCDTVVAIGPFTGERQDGFEPDQHPNFACPPCFYSCLPDLIFQGVGTLCANSAHITSGWGFRCSISPHGGSRLYGSTGSASTINFDMPAKRFGAFMGTNAGEGPDAQIDFFDPDGNPICTKTATFSAFCEWQWNGWRSSVPIGRIVITGNNPFGGGFVMLDDMEYDEFQACDEPCDMNCDGEINAFDIEPFLGILFDGDEPCNTCTGDTNGDGNVDAFDIEPFLNCLFP